MSSKDNQEKIYPVSYRGNTFNSLAEEVSQFYADPYGFVIWAFDWGYGVLDGFDGPDEWQEKFLKGVGHKVIDRGFDGIKAVEAIREATASGHGIGKGTVTAWLILWIMSTRPHARGVVTANTSAQLESKTWAELGKWKKLCRTGDWFEQNTGKGSLKLYHKKYPETWRCDAQTCKEENSEAFAGLHAAQSTPFYIFDEASAIPDVIWDVSEGGMTDGEPMWFAFGNPTRNTGRFRECFGRFRHRWNTRQIDSRNVKITNKTQIAEWIADYGDDSDFVRVRVKGEFPRAGSMQFIPGDIVDVARKRLAESYLDDPLIMGVDCARFGDDMSVICVRRGRDARTIGWRTFRGVDTMSLAAAVTEMAMEIQPDAIFVDGGGVGGGVVDRLNMLRQPVQEVQFGAKADRSMKTGEGDIVYANKSAEIWGYMKDWLKGAMIPDDPQLSAELTGREYGYVLIGGRDCIMLEQKKDMKKRGLASPDLADALALTFSYPVQPSRHEAPRGGKKSNFTSVYDPLSDKHIMES